MTQPDISASRFRNQDLNNDASEAVKDELERLRSAKLRTCLDGQLSGSVLGVQQDPHQPAGLEYFSVPKEMSILDLIKANFKRIKTLRGRMLLEFDSPTNTVSPVDAHLTLETTPTKVIPADADLIPEMTIEKYKAAVLKLALEQNFAGRVKQYKEAADGSLHLWLAPEGHTTKSLADTKYALRQSASDPFMYWYVGPQPGDQLVAPHLIIPNMTYKQFYSLSQ